MLKKLFCLLLCLLLPCCALADGIAAIMTDIIELSPEDRAALAEAMYYYMTLLGEKTPQPLPAVEEPMEPQMPQAPQKAQTYEYGGFPTPEDAVAFFLDGLKNQDLNQMLSAFAQESYIEHFSWEDYLVQYRVWQLNGFYYPMIGDMQRTVNIEMRRNQLISQIRRELLGESYTEWETPKGSGMVSLGKDAQNLADDFLREVFADNGLSRMREMQDVTISRIDLDEWQFTERQKGQYGVGEYADRSSSAHLNAEKVLPMEALLAVGDTRYWICVDAVCYEGKWHLLDIPGYFGSRVQSRQSSYFRARSFLFTEEQRSEMLAELDQ